MSSSLLACDTPVLLYLERVGQAHLLPTLFESVHVPEQVVEELDMGRLLRIDTIDPRGLDRAVIVSPPEKDLDLLPPNRLGIGERAVIAHALRTRGCWAGLDDLQARQLAAQLEVPVVGTLGILLRGKRVGLVDSVRLLLDRLWESGFHMSEDLYHEALRLAGEG